MCTHHDLYIRVSHRTDRIKTRSPSGLTSGEDHAIIHGILSSLRPVFPPVVAGMSSVVVVVVRVQLMHAILMQHEHEQRDGSFTQQRAVTVAILIAALSLGYWYARNQAQTIEQRGSAAI